MARLTAAGMAAALSFASPAAADPIARWRPLIEEASVRFGLPSAWIARVMRVESGGLAERAGRPVRSPKGAIGLMQLMPVTWADMRSQLGLGTDPDEPRDNILAGAFYLRLMYERFGYPGLFGAYNAGPARYAAWLAGRQPLPAETIAYLAAVGRAQPFVSRLSDQPDARPTAPYPTKPAPVIDPLFAIRRPAP
jgi:soluble lytic murein transglycosylase-like protein